MTQPQVLQAPNPYAMSMATACTEVEHFAQCFYLYPSRLAGISSEDVYIWAEQLEAAARKMQAIARKREAQGE